MQIKLAKHLEALAQWFLKYTAVYVVVPQGPNWQPDATVWCHSAGQAHDVARHHPAATVYVYDALLGRRAKRPALRITR